jgi:hypothetical protein
MKKYISLEHTIRKVVAEQNYRNEPVDEAISPVDYDKPKEVPQAFFKPVHIQPRKNGKQIPAGGPVRSRRNLEKEKSSETMHPNLKEEEQLDESAGLLGAFFGGARVGGGAAAKETAKRVKPRNVPDEKLPYAEPPPPAKPLDLPTAPNQVPVPVKPTPAPSPAPAKPAPATKVPEPVKPAPAKVEPAPKVPAPAPAPTKPAPNLPKPAPAKVEPVPVKVEPAPAPVTTPSPSTLPRTRTDTKTDTAPAPHTQTRTQTRTGRKPPTRPGLGRRLIDPAFPFPSTSGKTYTEPFYRSDMHKNPTSISRAKIRKFEHHKEEYERKEIEAVGRPGSKRKENVGRPDSKNDALTRQTEIVRKIIEDKKIVIKKNKEENMGLNPLVDTEPKLKHQQLDQGSEK